LGRPHITETHQGDTEARRKIKQGLPLINAENADQEPLPQRTRRGSQQSALSQRNSALIERIHPDEC
jgi:hypothetical protein